MPPSTRRQIVAQAIKARRPSATGGTTAPRSAARSGSTGLNRARPAPRGMGVGQAQALRPKVGPTLAGGAPAAANAASTPWDARYEQRVSGANKRYLDSYANFNLAEQGAQQDFGLSPGFNDYKANPNSRAALLEESFRRGNSGVINQAGLQLYSGSTSNRLAANRSSYGTKRDELMRAYQEALGEVNTGRTEAAQRRAEEEQQAYWDRVTATEGAPLDPEAAPAKGKKPSKRKGPARGKARVGRGRKAR